MRPQPIAGAMEIALTRRPPDASFNASLRVLPETLSNIRHAVHMSSPQSPPSLAFVAADTPDAREAAARLAALYGQEHPETADVLVALGGDGFMLQTTREAMRTGARVFGMNRGTVGFLMNEYREEDLRARIAGALAETIRPLEMKCRLSDGTEMSALAVNEVSLFRQSYQAAKIRILVDGQQRLDELVCDGVMVATPAGSTAYNLSAHGPILPLDSQLLALTPVSPFRPRRWRGALLPSQSTVEFVILEAEKRPVNAVADHVEAKSVLAVTVRESREVTATILFDANHSWRDRILAEQFRY